MSDLNGDSLPATQYLLMETLAARVRTGETCWTFPRKPAIKVALDRLREAGYVLDYKSPDGENWQVFPTDTGIKEFTDSNYVIPLLRNKKKKKKKRKCHCV